jgi:hypothetical protein
MEGTGAPPLKDLLRPTVASASPLLARGWGPLLILLFPVVFWWICHPAYRWGEGGGARDRASIRPACMQHQTFWIDGSMDR